MPSLLHKDHLPGLHELAGFKPIEVHTAGELAAAPAYAVITRIHRSIDQRGDFLAYNVVDDQRDVPRFREVEPDISGGIEWVGVVPQ